MQNNPHIAVQNNERVKAQHVFMIGDDEEEAGETS